MGARRVFPDGRLASKYQVVRRMGDVSFNDPPYGLPSREKDTKFRELPFFGGFRVTPQGVVSLVVRNLERRGAVG